MLTSPDYQHLINGINFANNLGLKIDVVQLGFSRGVIEPKETLLNHLGYYQAGVYFTASEVIGGLACAPAIDLYKDLLVTTRGEIQYHKASNEQITFVAEAKKEDLQIFSEKLGLKGKSLLTIKIMSFALENLVSTATFEYYVRKNKNRKSSSC